MEPGSAITTAGFMTFRCLRWGLIVGLVFATGCLFEPREANPPGSGSGWVQPDFPTKVFSNLESGLEDRTGGNYDSSIGDEFTFIPHFSDLAYYLSYYGEDPYANWDRSVEIEVMLTIIDRASKIEVNFGNPIIFKDEGNFSQWDTFYTLQVTNDANPSQVDVYKGKARFDFRLGAKGFELVKWEDIELVEGFPTWGYLRGQIKPLISADKNG